MIKDFLSTATWIDGLLVVAILSAVAELLDLAFSP
jgi:hypothetical protein